MESIDVRFVFRCFSSFIVVCVLGWHLSETIRMKFHFYCIWPLSTVSNSLPHSTKTLFSVETETKIKTDDNRSLLCIWQKQCNRRNARARFASKQKPIFTVSGLETRYRTTAFSYFTSVFVFEAIVFRPSTSKMDGFIRRHSLLSTP